MITVFCDASFYTPKQLAHLNHARRRSNLPPATHNTGIGILARCNGRLFRIGHSMYVEGGDSAAAERMAIEFCLKRFPGALIFNDCQTVADSMSDQKVYWLGGVYDSGTSPLRQAHILAKKAIREGRVTCEVRHKPG